MARMERRVPLLVEALVFLICSIACVCVGKLHQDPKLRLQRCVNFGARIVTGLGHREHISGALRELGWRLIEDMIAERDLCVMYNLNHVESVPELRSRITRRSDVSVRETRATYDGELEVPRARTEFARRSFFHRAVRARNGPLPSTRNASFLPVFKKCITHVF